MSKDLRPIHEVNLKWRTWYKGVPPQRIKLEIPGWSGDKGWIDPQAWHCKPWIDGTTYGLELVYPFETECRVIAKNGVCEFIGDFSKEKEKNPVQFNHWEVPFSAFAPDHFGFTSSVDIQTEEGQGTMILPHPRYYTDRTGTVPCPVMGFLESDWWPKIFFVVFKAPLDNQEYIFRQGEPYASLLILPKKVKYNINQMTKEEETARASLDRHLQKNGRQIATERFVDSKKQPFDNKYKVLSSVARTQGIDVAKQQMANPAKRYKIAKRLFIKKRVDP